MFGFGLNQHKRAAIYHMITLGSSADKAAAPFILHIISQQPSSPNWSKKLVLITTIIAVLHITIWYVADKLPTQPLQETKPSPVVIEIIKPEPLKVIKPETLQIVEKPKTPPLAQKPQQVVQKPVEQLKLVEQPKPQPIQKVVTQPVVQPVEESVVRKNVTPGVTPTPTPQPVATNLPVTEAKGYAGYLSNPAPEYPDIALDSGWEGSVLLRVKVAASGHPLEVNIKQGSNRKVLDDAAVRTVKRWKFSPAMRGSQPIEGWVDVPIHYQLPR